MAIELHLPERTLSEQMLGALSRANPAYRFERSVEGKLVVAPSGLFASAGEGELFAQVLAYAKRTALGRAFPATGGFTLPDTSIVAPDATFVSNERLAALTFDDRQFAYVELAPDVVFELLSPSDRRSELEAKMRRYLSNGVRVAVLITDDGAVTLFRSGETPSEHRDGSVTVGAEMPGFTLDTGAIAAALR